MIAYQIGNYALRPTELTVVEVEIPRPVPESSGDAELRVGSLNTLNLCAGSCDPVKLARIADYIGTVLGKIEIVLFRSGEEDYRVECWRSFSPYAFGLLVEGAEDAGL